jgi:ribosome-associated translation inhibitor RaiA
VIDVDVTTRGAVSRAEASRATTLLARLDRCLTDPVLGARVMLRRETNARLERPARAEAEVDVNGRIVCGRVAAATMPQAIGELAERVERQPRDFGDRRARLRRRPHVTNGAWRHGAQRAVRPGYFPRPVAEREVIRRKSFALEPLEPLQALAEMLDLDHDFYLFRDSPTGADAVVYRRDDGSIGLISQGDAVGQQLAEDGLVQERSRFSGPIMLGRAVSEMDALSRRFLFFTDSATGTGSVIYMRYDGNYGLIESAT